MSLPRMGLFGSRSRPDADRAELPACGVAVDVVNDAGHSLATENPSGHAQALARALA
ncbi:hypothetical protein AACH06_10835 [Ideonella sp. DXS29W]|uniref:Alpha/beta hydrolase n=1 Tax=Ideonella lacteola TaxID=2984193 RepID=A0ABU9BMX6_9BURK